MEHTEVFDLYQSGRQNLEQGSLRQAVHDLEEAARLEPDSPAIQRLLAVAYFRTASLGRAEQAARAVVEANPADAETTHLLGRCLTRQNRPDEARPWLRLAAAMDPRPEYVDAVPADRASSAGSMASPDRASSAGSMASLDRASSAGSMAPDVSVVDDSPMFQFAIEESPAG